MGHPHSPLRIAHVTATFPPYRGGTGAVAYQNAFQLALLGHDVHVFTAAGPPDGGLGPDGETDDPPGVTVRRLQPRIRFGNAPLLRGLAPALRPFDLVHLHYPFYFGGEQVWWASARYGVPYVATYHQDVVLPWPLSWLAEAHHRLAGEGVLRSARLVLATTLDYAARSRLASLPPQLVQELPNSVDTQIFRPGLDARGLRQSLAVGEEQPVALFVGALDRAHYFKGVPVLLQALSSLPGAALVVVGDGDLRPRYQQAAQEAGLGARVRFVGPVVPTELPLYYALADVAVLPSTTRGEAFGVVLIEAMACGTPVVASDLPGVQAVVDHGLNGYLAPPGNAAALAARLRGLLADPALRARMGESGRRKAEARYDARQVGARLEEVYRKALEPTAHPLAQETLTR
ncbi:MAG: glycosyltransferase family 4 protein [Chloroflexi bacterium]|nr:glycosyltransferase family 4 protein [Chloroflexota bacterium]